MPFSSDEKPGDEKPVLLTDGRRDCKDFKIVGYRNICLVYDNDGWRQLHDLDEALREIRLFPFREIK